MSHLKARNKLIHAILWLRSEGETNPRWASAGVYFALRLLSEKQSTFFSNCTHRSTHCLRCAEILAVASMRKEGTQ